MLTPELHQLNEALPLLSQKDRMFAADLLRAAQRYGRLTPNQTPWVAKLIERARPVSHDLPGLAPAATVHSLGDFQPVIALFGRAAQHLKYPKIRLLCGSTPIVLSVAGERSKAPGMVNITGEGQYPNRAWYGRIDPANGQWDKPRGSYEGDFGEQLRATLVQLASDPAGTAAVYGKLTGNCCFCQRELTDARSVTAGYGPVCADHYGLSAQWSNAVCNVSIETPAAPIVAAMEYQESLF